MIRLAIVDDEDIYSKQLTEYLYQFGEEKQEKFDIVCFRDGDEILENYSGDYDIILMDIQMEFMDGMTAAEKIREIDREVIIMFITNMINYAIKGYEVDALDYIVKPVEYYMFSKKLDRAMEKVKRAKPPLVMIKIQSGIMKFSPNDIYYVESEGHNLFYTTKTGTYKTRARIQDAEEELKQFSFARNNKSYLVNLQYVEGVEDGCCIIKGKRLLISRPRKNEFMEAITKYIGGI